VSQTPDIRWKQRLSHFERALDLLRDALKLGHASLSLLEKEGTVQRFEYSLELAWKTAKDYLEATGTVILPVTPRQVIKEAIDAKIIADGQVWIDMLDHRNLLSHTYDSAMFEEAVEAIVDRYLPAMEILRKFLSDESKK
jgi:nucleotidyltransferase substrate binding protein (TIGR01987 family)